MLQWIVIRIGAAPLADGFVDQIACLGVGTASGKDARRLVGQMLCRINHFRFERDLMTDVLAVLDLVNLPGLICHVSLLTVFPVYRKGNENSSDTRHKSVG